MLSIYYWSSRKYDRFQREGGGAKCEIEKAGRTFAPPGDYTANAAGQLMERPYREAAVGSIFGPIGKAIVLRG